jgi:hypothetical protein
MFKQFIGGILLSGAVTLAFSQEVWTSRTSGTTLSLNGVVWAGAQFVAVGRSDGEGSKPGTILTSPDGVTWTTQVAGTNSTLNAVIRNGAQLVAVGTQGGIVTSTDGITWTARTSGTTQHLNAVTWTGSQYVAVGYNGTVLTSPDAVTWTLRPSATPNIELKDVAASGSMIVAVGTEGYLQSSPDGITWTTRPNPSAFTITLSGIAWNGTKFAAITYSSAPGFGRSPTLTSPDGITWTENENTLKASMNAILWTGAQFVAVGTNGFVATSPNAVDWTPRVSGTTGYFNAITLTGAGTLLLAVGDNYNSEGIALIMTSPVVATAVRMPQGAKRPEAPGMQGILGTIEGYRPDGRVPSVK